jgi:biotin-dependent carboxylase-like uncharacterized protein
MIEVHDPGFSTTVQDTGRFGHYHIGVPPSGAMDQFAHKVANYLVGNEVTAATLEMTYQGCTLTFDEERVVAVTGADMSPTLNGEPAPTWTAFQVEANDELSFEFATEGTRSYLAIAGGFDVPPIMESQSTYTLIGIGGYEGRQLEEGDTLTVGKASDRTEMVDAEVADEHVPSYGDEGAIRVVMGLCDYRLTGDGEEAFLEAEWTVSDEADRVGYRFDGPDIESMFEEREQPFGAGTDPTNVVDLGYPIGSIQMAGQPIIVMRDAVTGGGYATIGTVISPDRDRLAQRQTHNSVQFQSIGVEEALEIRSERDTTLDEIQTALSQ